MWKNTVEPGKPQMTTWRMRTACRITESTNTHLEYVILVAFALGQWLHERVLVLRLFVHCFFRSFVTTLIRLHGVR